MILDKQLVFSEAQAITVSALSENTLDFGVTGLDIGQGTPIYLEVWLDTAFDTSANTLTIDLYDGATVGAVAKHMEVLPATATSSLLAANVGLLAKVALPNDMLRHVALYYTCSAALTSGKINAFLTIG